MIPARSILTFTGRYVDPLELRPADVSVDDIAHALSNQCRFTGHTRVFYSVAEHSCRLAVEMARDGHRPDVCLWGLLHDAPEAYLVDLPRPLKHDDVIGKAFRRAEQLVMAAIAEAFGLVPFEPEAIKVYDVILLATERRDLMPTVGDWPVLEGVKPLDGTIRPVQPGEAREEFLRLFALFNRMAAAA